MSDNNDEASVKDRLGVKGIKRQGELVGHWFQHLCKGLYDFPCGLHKGSDKDKKVLLAQTFIKKEAEIVPFAKDLAREGIKSSIGLYFPRLIWLVVRVEQKALWII